ncbi:hypothetical protein ACU4I5_18520 [Ensifer adhaerens]
MTDDRLPNWPAALNQKMAAAYCSLSVGTFKRVCPVKPIKFTQSAQGARYLRASIDAWLTMLDPNTQNAAKSPERIKELLSNLGKTRAHKRGLKKKHEFPIEPDEL